MKTRASEIKARWPVEYESAITTHTRSESTETAGCAQDALKILKEFNYIRNDTEAYLYDVIKWGLGEVDEQPNPDEYGLS